MRACDRIQIQTGMAQWVARLTHIPLSREFESHRRLRLIL